MDEYREFVREHPAQVKRMEEMGRLVAMFLPVSRLGRFSEVFQESTYSVLGLVSLYHDRIIQKAQQGAAAARDEAQSQATRAIRLALTLFAHTEVVLEMLARIFGGEVRRMQLIYLVECLKALGRLVLLGQGRAGSLLLAGGQFEAKVAKKVDGEPAVEITELDTETAADGATDIEQGGRRLGTAAEDTEQAAKEDSAPPRWRGKRSGKTLPLPAGLRGFDNVTAAEAAQTAENGSDTPGGAEAGRSPASGSKGGEGLGAGPEDVLLRLSGEVLHILRPVVYVAMLRRSSAKRGGTASAWGPFAVSLGLELLSLRCSSVATPPGPGDQSRLAKSVSGDELVLRAMQKLAYGQGAGKAKASAATKAEEDELRRRRSLFAMYLMRSPLFDRLTMPAVRKVAGGLGGLPGVGESIESMLVETVMYYHRNHFYVSGS